MEIKAVWTEKESQQLNQLLWDVLWKPLDLPRNIRETFRLDGNSIELIALKDSKVIGGLAAYWTGDNEIELRHIAVSPDFQKQSVGGLLLMECISRVEDKATYIKTHARNTSIAFFEKLGFVVESDDWEERSDFTKHDIKFKLMRYTI